MGVATSEPPALADPSPMATMTTSVMTPIAAYTPRPPRSAQRARDIGVDRSTSSRPSVSSEAQPRTSVAVANPARMSPK